MASDRESVIKMKHIDSVGTNETNINELFKQKCLFSIEDHEVKRIQHAVEIMIRFILTCMYEHTSFVKSMYCKKISLFKSSLKIYNTFNDEHLLKVGSFYEKTKNRFPDEFDFVCVIAECYEKDYVLMKKVTATIADKFHKHLRKTVLKPLHAGTCIKFIEFKGLHGPAAKLEFSYVNSNSDETRILVDISPASRVMTKGYLPRELKIKYPEWRNGVVATGSVLILKFYSAGHPKHKTKIKPSICEFEKKYILTEMSEKHRRVYRLLKYLLNGESISDDLQRIVRSKGNQAKLGAIRIFYPRVAYDFSSYSIKALMFYHCLLCSPLSSTTTSQCVMSVLDYILTLFQIEEKKVELCKYLRLPIPFSVSFETMTGEQIEMTDSYGPAMKIKKTLQTIRTDVFENRVTESSCLAQEMLPVVQQHVKDRKVRPRRERIAMQIIVLAALVGLSGFFLMHGNTKIEKQIRMCWNGTDYISNMNYSVNVYANRSEYRWTNMSIPLTVIQDNSNIANGETFCLDYNNAELRGEQSDGKMINVSRIFYCGNHDSSSCLFEDIIYLIKVEKHGFVQRVVCCAIATEKNQQNITQNTNGYKTGRELACFQKETVCLNIKRREYVFGVLTNEQALRPEDQQSCMENFSNQSKPVNCNVSQQWQDSNKTKHTDICCCEGHACGNTENDAQIKRADRTFSPYSIVASVLFVILLCIGCRFFWLWCQFPRRQQERVYDLVQQNETGVYL